MEKHEKKTARKKGEEGYHERNTAPATDAAALAHSVFETAEEFSSLADQYFSHCDLNGELYGEAGLCLYLSKHNAKGRSVTLATLRGWYDGSSCEHLQDAVQLAYLRIQSQVESDPRYREKGGMATRAIFMQKQKRFGGYQDKSEVSQDTKVHIIHGDGMDESDFR